MPLPKRAEDVADDHHYVMEGYCPVAIQEQGIWVRGNYRNLVKHEGRKYLVAGENEKQMFLAEPERYAPALGGDCIVSLSDDGKLVPGSVYHSLIVEGKLYLFAGSEQERAFKADPTDYFELDGGNKRCTPQRAKLRLTRKLPSAKSREASSRPEHRATANVGSSGRNRRLTSASCFRGTSG